MLSKILSLSSDVSPEESRDVALLLANLFLALVSYYVIKTVREPLILESGGADLKAYAAAVQAGVLIGFVPLYSWLTKTFDRLKLTYVLLAFFLVSIEGFWLGAQFGVPNLGFIFYVWVGIFSLSLIAQFWSYANDLYDKDTGKRLFPVIAIGATLGSPIGSVLASFLFDMGVDAYSMLHVSAGILVVHALLYTAVEKLQSGRPAGPSNLDEPEEPEQPEQSTGTNGFLLVARNPYLIGIAAVLIVLNLVNTTGEFILGSYVVDMAEAAVANGEAETRQAYIGSFYGEFFSIVNVATFIVQALLVSRIVKYLGMKGVLFALPIVSLGVYGLAAAGAGFAVFRWAKTAENSTDYSVMNTAKAMLWLPTMREEKYQAKQTIDTFFVRFGDVLAAGLVFLGTEILSFSLQTFAVVNVGLVAVWMALSVFVLLRYRSLAEEHDVSPNEVLS